MILSMTGFGRCEIELDERNIIIDVKSLNSKQLDISTRLPVKYKEKEMEIRKLLSSKLARGKIELMVFVENGDNDSAAKINRSVVENYFTQINNITIDASLNLDKELISTILQLPNVFKTEQEKPDDTECNKLIDGINKAIDNCIEYRKEEGRDTYNDIKEKVLKISELLKDIAKYETERLVIIKTRIKENLSLLNLDSEPDKNRLEQEIIYYLEKLDINEEKVRLKKHCDFFIDTLDSETSQGKKLAFISQEIGREINTLGSKANHAEMQKVVILMKDELEKIKEQLFNIL